jgi:hypothetical protein
MRLAMLRISTIAMMVVRASTALANTKPTEDEAAKVMAALAEWSCEGETIEKETEATVFLKSTTPSARACNAI